MNYKAIRIIWVALALSLVWPSPVFAQESTGPKEQAAIAAAEKFLALVDAGQYAESWEAASACSKARSAKRTGSRRSPASAHSSEP